MNQDRVEQLYKEGKYQEAWWAYTALAARGDIPADVHLWGAKAAYGLGHLHSALHAMDQGLPVAIGDDVGRIRFAHATLRMELGGYEEAMEEFQRWITDLPQYSGLEATHLGMAYYHLGLICRRLERFSESIHYYETACDYLSRYDRRQDLCKALQNLAWVACLNGDESEAARALAQAEPLCQGPSAHWHQQIGQAFVQAVSRSGDLHNVMTLCQAIIQYDGDDLPLSVRSHAFWLAGRVAMELTLGDTARVMAEQALWFAAVVADDRCLSDAARLIAEVDRRFATTA